MLAFLGVVVHGIIPHHHHNLDDSEVFSHHNHHGENEHDDADNHNDKHFPANHQHLSAAESFDIRTNSNYVKDVNLLASYYITLNDLLFCFHKPDPPEKIYYSFAIHCISYIFSTPNSMRGSPSIA